MKAFTVLGILFFTHLAQAGTFQVVQALQLPEFVSSVQPYGAGTFHLFRGDEHGHRRYVGIYDRAYGEISVADLEAGQSVCSVGLLYDINAAELFHVDYPSGAKIEFYRYSGVEVAPVAGIPYAIFGAAGLQNNAKGTLVSTFLIGLNSNCQPGLCTVAGLPAWVASGKGSVKFTTVSCAVSIKQGGPKVEPAEVIRRTLGQYLQMD